jgi:hypothetical protein
MSSSTTSPLFKVLTKDNYNEWVGNMKASLMSNGPWRLVSGRELRPTEAVAVEKWENKAEKAAGLIFLAVSPAQQVTLRAHQEDPIAMWNILEKQHVSKKPGARLNAYNALFTITKLADESLMDEWKLQWLTFKIFDPLLADLVDSHWTLLTLSSNQWPSFVHSLRSINIYHPTCLCRTIWTRIRFWLLSLLNSRIRLMLSSLPIERRQHRLGNRRNRVATVDIHLLGLELLNTSAAIVTT